MRSRISLMPWPIRNSEIVSLEFADMIATDDIRKDDSKFYTQAAQLDRENQMMEKKRKMD
jgi:hypothetical protein